MYRTIAIALFVVSASAGLSSAAERCLLYRDVDRTTLLDASTLVIQTKGGHRFKVLVDAECKHIDRPQNYFSERHSSIWECVEPGDAWHFTGGATCFVQSVTPVQDEPAR